MRPPTRALALLALLLLVAIGVLIARAQPAPGSEYEYLARITLNVTSTGIPGGLNGSASCTFKFLVRVVNVTKDYVTFNVTLEGSPNCTSTGNLGGFKVTPTLPGGSGVRRVPRSQGFDPSNLSVYVDPEKLPSGGVYEENHTRDSLVEHDRIVYDTETGMLREALVHMEGSTVIAGASIHFEEEVRVELVSSHESSGSGRIWIAVGAAAAVIVVAAATALLLGRRSPAPQPAPQQ